MKQHHYLFDSLNDLQRACADLEDMGVAHRHLHVVSNDVLSLEKRHLNPVSPFQENDMIHTGLRGFVLGAIAAGSVGWAISEWLAGHELMAVIAGFCCLVILGFCTWVGGLIGASHDNWRLSPYHDQMEKGQSLLVVDVTPSQELEVVRLMAAIHREARHTGEVSSIDTPFSGGWNLHLKDYKEVA